MHQFSSVQFICSVTSDSATPWTAACQASLPITTNSWSLLKHMTIELVMPSNHLILCPPLLLLPSPSLLHPSPTSGSFPMSQFFTSGGQSIGVSASASVLPMNIQTDFLYEGLVGSPWSSKDSQESSPTRQFKSINSSALSFLYRPTLTAV